MFSQKYIILFFSWCVLVLLQLSFFPHFPLGPFGYLPFFILLLFPALSEKHGEYGSLVFAFAAGLMLDIPSERFFGFWALLFFLVEFVLRTLLVIYIRRPS